MSSQDPNLLQSIIERCNPNSIYHAKCVGVLDRALPTEVLDELRTKVVIIEAAAEETKPLKNAHASLIMLTARLLAYIGLDIWDRDSWVQGIVDRNLNVINSHLNRIPDSEEYAHLRRAITSLLWQSVYFDAIQGARTYETPHNLDYYLDAFLDHTQVSLASFFLFLSDSSGRLSHTYAEMYLSIVEDAIEDIIREAASDFADTTDSP